MVRACIYIGSPVLALSLLSIGCGDDNSRGTEGSSASAGLTLTAGNSNGGEVGEPETTTIAQTTTT